VINDIVILIGRLEISMRMPDFHASSIAHLCDGKCIRLPWAISKTNYMQSHGVLK